MYSTSKFIAIFLFTSGIFRQNLIGKIDFGKNVEIDPNETYDFIVIGGGTAGSYVASKLSENPKFNILLLERSGSGNDFTDIPLYNNAFQMKPKGYKSKEIFVKIYNSTKQDFACSKRGSICKIKQGNDLGGGSNFNGLYARGSPIDYDSWESMGAIGWSYKDVLPFFKLTEKCISKRLIADGYHGTKGNQIVTNRIGFRNVAPLFQSAASENGFVVHSDYNDAQYTNSFDFVQSYSNGFTYNSRRAFLEPVLKRKNLKVLCFSKVIQILFDGKKSIGVKYIHNGDMNIAKVSKEIIVSAGAIDTPKLLLLSGIGNRETLNKFGIPIVANIPAVGKSLQDQAGLILSFRINPKFYVDNISYRDVQKYFNNRTGILSKQPAFYVGFLNIKPYSRNDNDTRMELTFSIQTKSNETLLTLQINNLIPKSKGFISIRSNDPLDDPIVNPNYFAEREDREIFMIGIKMGLKFMKSKSLNPLDLELKSMNSSCGMVTMESLLDDKFLDCYIQTFNAPIFHLTSSCRMGNGSDIQNTVVDPTLKIIGIENVRIIDASIMPHIIRGNTNGPVTMIAAKGTAMIMKEYS